MLLLVGFAFLAGAGTALSPCALPVLPALLSAGGTGGRRRPVGVVLGLSLTFTVTIVGLANVVDGVGLGNDPLRDLSIVGAAGVRPGAADARRGRPPRGAAVASGAVRSAHHRRRLPVGPARGRRPRLRLHALREPDPRGGDLRERRLRQNGRCSPIAYAAGSAAVLLALSLGGRRVFDRVRSAGRGPALGRALGAIMILTALAIAHQPRRQLRPAHRRKDPQRQPHRVARVLEIGHRPAARNHRPPHEVHSRQRLGRLRRRSLLDDPRGRRATPARPRCWPTPARCPTWEPHPNSRKPRTGSTRASPGRPALR